MKKIRCVHQKQFKISTFTKDYSFLLASQIIMLGFYNYFIN